MLNKRNKILILILTLMIFVVSFSACLNVDAAKIECATCGEKNDHETADCPCCTSCGLVAAEYHVNNSCPKCPLCNGVHNYGKLKQKAGVMPAYDVACKANGSIFAFGTPGLDKPNGSFFDIGNLIKFDTGNAGFSTAMSVAQDVYNKIANLGMIVVLIYFFIELYETHMNDAISYEELARMAIKTLAGFLLIRNGFELITLMVDLCTSVIENLALTNPSFSAGDTCPVVNLEKYGIFAAFALFFEFLIPYAVMNVACCVLRIICWSRIFDILIRIMLAPVGMADIINGGSKSNGVRYLKKLMSSLLQGACIVATINCYNLMQDVLSNTMAGALGIVLTALALIVAIKQTGKIANDVMGL
jgi:hypothetical protein